MFWKKKKIYMDYAAATPVSASVRDAMAPYWNDIFYHPGALYDGAVQARHTIEDARQRIAKQIGCQDRNIVFTAGGTESNNLAIQGVVRVWQKKNPGKKPHVIITAIEHAGVRETCLYLKQIGHISLDMIPVDSDGRLSLSDLKEFLNEDTALVSIGHANSEIGVVQPIEDVLKMIRHFKKNTHGDRAAEYPVFHTDAIATIGYMDVKPGRMNADLVSLSAAKIYGPKGIAMLYIRDGVEVAPLILGGGQEKSMRSGTENVPLIVGFAQALDDIASNREKEAARLAGLQKDFFKRLGVISQDLKKKFSFLEQPIVINGSLEHRLPNNINLSVEKLSSEQLVLELNAKGIMVSSRAACSEKDNDSSYVIEALAPGHDSESGSIRFTLGKDTTEKDIEVVCETFQQVLEKLFTTYQEYTLQ